MMLVANPVAYPKLAHEIDSAIVSGNVSYPVITHSEALRMGYRQAVIWEG